MRRKVTSWFGNFQLMVASCYDRMSIGKLSEP